MNEIKIYLTIGEKKNEGEWVTLPMDKDELEEMMGQLEGYSIADHECDIPRLEINADTSIEALNELAEQLDTLSSYDYNKLCAMLELESSGTVDVAIEVIETLDEIELLTNVETDEDLGRYYAEECCILSGLPETVQEYFNFSAYGRDIRWQTRSCLTNYGFVIDNR